MAGPCCGGGAGAHGGGAEGWLISIVLGLPALLAASFTKAPLLTTVIGAPLILVLLSAYPLLVLLTPVRREEFASERVFTTIDAKTGEERTGQLPDLVKRRGSDAKQADDSALQLDADTADLVDLTVVVPAYNEKERLCVMLDDALAYLEPSAQPSSSAKGNGAANGNASNGTAGQHGFSGSYEILIIDDGSSDGTAELALRYAKDRHTSASPLKRGQIRVVRLKKNRGKGGAVRHGVLHSRGAQILFADADGATDFSDLGTLQAEMARIRTPAGHGVVVGSRAHMVGSEAVVKRSKIRNFLMHSFHLFLSLLLRPPSPQQLLLRTLGFAKAVPGRRGASSKKGSTRRRALPSQPEVRDTQCGFKLFTRATAQVVFPLAHIERWIFDVELLLLAEMASDATLRDERLLCARSDAAADADQDSDDGIVRAARKAQQAARSGSGSGRDKGNGAAPAGGAADSDSDAEDVLLDLPVPIAEVAVRWQEVGGSKIDLLKDSIGMALDLLVIRANYALGRWKRPGPVRIDAQ